MTIRNMVVVVEGEGGITLSTGGSKVAFPPLWEERGEWEEFY